MPPGWTDADIGSPGVAGSAALANGVWTVAGGGGDIWNAADQFNFASEPFLPDGAVIAQVKTVKNTDPWAKAGVMLRNDSTAGSVNVTLVISAGNGVNFQWRDTANGQCNSVNIPGLTAPIWVALTRSANNINGFYSSDGTNWTQAGSTEPIVMNGSILAGLCVTAHNNSLLSSATFSNVTVSTPTFGVYRELWTNLNPNIGGLTVLTNTDYNPAWPNSPVASFTHVFTNFETEINSGINNYGQRVRGFIVPPESGPYTFWIASDDNSQLFLSTDETPAHSVPIANVTAWTPSEDWYEYASQESPQITLQAGSRYYIEAQMQQGGGGDDLAVGWQLPDGTLEQPMSAQSAAGTLLLPCNGVNTPPGIYSQSSAASLVEGASTTLQVLATNWSPLTYHWFSNGAPVISGASSLALDKVSLAENDQTYTCVVSNALGTMTSAPIVLTVAPDTVPPVVSRIFNVGISQVDIVFSKPVTALSAGATTNYVFTDGLAVNSTALGTDDVTVVLNTSPLLYSSNYSVVINGILDRAFTPVPIAANTTTNFTASPFVPADIGAPAIPSSATIVSNGVTVEAGGSAIGGQQDQFGFQYQLVSGNFDVTVRLASLGLSSVWAEAGLMARQDLSAGSAFAAALATPAMVGASFASRATENAAAVSAGNFPVNYPNTWLRLSRVGNVFTGFASYDGQNWTALGTATETMPTKIYLGFSVVSDATNQATVADFVNFTNTPPGTAIANEVNPSEPLGPSSRKTQIVFSEIMYKPAPRSDTNNLEYVEIYNSQPWFHDISHYQIVCADMNYTFPPGTTIPGGGFLVVAASPGSIRNVYGINNVMGPYKGSLKKAETLELLDEQSNVLLTVPYTSASPWPLASDGQGHSMVLANPSYGEGDPRAWGISDIIGGSPGTMESYQPNPLRNVFINELLAHSENPAVPQFVELYNHANQAVDVSGCILTDGGSVNKFVIPSGTMLPAGGFVSFTETQLGFPLNPAGETLYFIQGDGSRVLDAVQFPGQSDGVSWGRWPDGANDFYYFQTRTPGTNNSAIAIGPVAINELMYDPITENDDDQYVELYNQSTNALSLAGWQFTAGITYAFPPTAVIPANGYVVVGRNVANLLSKYSNLTSSNTFGNFSGKLSHNGERVALTMPQSLYGTNSVTVVEDEVTYGVGGRWGQWSGGGGSSLELIDPHANHRLAANWADSDETKKSSWVNIENTGVLDNGANYESGILHAQIGLLDIGECLVDNVEVDFNGVNYIANPTFESGLGNWTPLGDHSRSSLDSGGYLSSFALHMRATDRMWNGVNSCEANLNANSMAQGSTVTLRFKARWLHGWPEALLRLNGGWLEATGPLPVPANLGTPGAPNSAYVTNAGPAIYRVAHTPSVPAANQPVVVTARMQDPDGVQSLVLHYRIDPSLAYVSVAMNDTGTLGDAIAKDGIFSATIPAQAANKIVAFYLTATDDRTATTRFPALVNNNAPVRECVVMFGDTVSPGAFTTYHSWITQTNVTRWSNLPNLSNETCDFTFVNNSRIIYNAQGRFAGSPYHQDFNTPVGNLCHYKWVFPDDDDFLGATDFNKIHQPGNGPGDDASLQREQIANTFLRALGVPWLNRRYVAVYVNGNRRGALMEDAQTPSADIVKEHFPNDSGGFLFKMQPWFEFAPFPSGGSLGFNNNSWCQLLPFTTTGGVLKIARYRYNFEMRRTPDSANDYADVFSLIGAANSSTSPNYNANMKNLANMENWMRVFAANHAAGNWDAFGAQTGQNLYGYIGALGTKYSLLMWDFNIVLGNSDSWGPGQNLFTLNGDPNMAAIFANPEFLRMYWRALQELVNGPLAPSVSGPLANAKYTAFANSGLGVENPKSAILPWLGQAQSSIAAQLAAVNAAAFSVNPNIVVSNNVAYVSGAAPVNVDTVSINGGKWPLVWTGLTTWTISMPLQPGVNQLDIVGLDRSGNPIPGDSGSAQATVNSAASSPVGQVVINEIMYNPAVSNAQFVEFYNNSTNTEFDLSGWQAPELSYAFPAGATIAPNSFLVLAANAPAYDNAYGAVNPFFDLFSGALPQSGQTLLSLVKPGSGGSSNLVVAQVQYSDQLPWPTNVKGTGASLQLVDSHQDNWRAGNWASASSNGPPVAQWVHVAVTGTASTSLLYIYLQSAGDVYVDDIVLVAGSEAEVGPNLLTDGGFESGFPGSVWEVSPNLSASILSSTVKHSGNASLHVISSSPGTTKASSIWQVMSPAVVTNEACTLSFWYLQSTNGGPLTIRLSSSGTVATVNPAPPATAKVATPDMPNSVATTLPEFPTLWINEVEPENLTGITNSAGQHSPWVELYNPGTNAVALGGLFLATNYSALTNWAFPTGATINAGAFIVVFADGETNLSKPGEWHAGFVLPSVSGSVALSRLYDGAPQVLDYVDYANLLPNDSYGSFPDGQSFVRQIFSHPTPGAANDGSSVPPPSFIPYLDTGEIYAQDFDALPDPGATSVGAANPVTINGVNYSLSNPFDFAFPASSSGKNGGLGLPALTGWYGLADPTASVGTRFGATAGDDTTGGDLSFGLAGSANRALGLLATSTTGYTAFGAKFINGTGETLNYINLQFTAEVWRQSNLAKTLEFYYDVDPTGTNAFSTASTAFLPELNVSFPTVAGDVGGVPVDGTAPDNQASVGVVNQYITNWPPGGALWLVWEMASSAGKSQGLGIDNLMFSATAAPVLNPVTVTAQSSGTNVVLGWVGLPGQTYQIQYATNLTDPAWLPLNAPVPGTGAAMSFTNIPGASLQQFYRLAILPPEH